MKHWFMPLLTALGCAAASAAHAGAWPEPSSHWLGIDTFSYYRVQVDGFNQLGEPAGRGRYTQYEISPYIEYGLTNRWTIGLQPRAQYVVQSGLPGTGHALGLVQLNLFARYALYQDGWNVLSVQGQYGIPGAQNVPRPELAQPGAEYEARLLYGHGFKLPSGMNGFIDAETGYRIEVGGWADQLRADVTAGLRPTADWLLLAQSFNTVSLGHASSTGADYNLYRIQLSVVHDLTPHVALQVGVWRDMAGRNIALGNAAVAAIWLRF